MAFAVIANGFVHLVGPRWAGGWVGMVLYW
jgi:hypothetical protein